MTTWLIVAGDFVTHGGMDAANYGLARYLASREDKRVHLVAHRVAPDLAAQPRVRVHRAPRLFGVHRFGEPLLRTTAERWMTRLRPAGARIIANGANVDAEDVSWVHYVHSAYEPTAHGFVNRLLVTEAHRRYVAAESYVLRRARIVICNSRRTAEDVVQYAGVNPARTRVVYYGIDTERFRATGAVERLEARQALGLGLQRPLVLFAGALGDRRKGFDTLFAAWQTLCAEPDWDADLLVAGAGAELRAWAARTRASRAAGRIRFLKFQRDMRPVFAACDVLVHPARYEAYGLAVHEALCCGLPAIVSARAGVAERYPEPLRGLLLQDVESASELAARLRAWRSDGFMRSRAAAFGDSLRPRSWDDMGRDIVEIVEGPQPA